MGGVAGWLLNLDKIELCCVSDMILFYLELIFAYFYAEPWLQYAPTATMAWSSRRGSGRCCREPEPEKIFASFLSLRWWRNSLLTFFVEIVCLLEIVYAWGQNSFNLLMKSFTYFYCRNSLLWRNVYSFTLNEQNWFVGNVPA